MMCSQCGKQIGLANVSYIHDTGTGKDYCTECNNSRVQSLFGFKSDEDTELETLRKRVEELLTENKKLDHFNYLDKELKKVYKHDIKILHQALEKISCMMTVVFPNDDEQVMLAKAGSYIADMRDIAQAALKETQGGKDEC